MFRFKSKNKTHKICRYICVHQNDKLLFDGKWDDIPFGEEVILEYSIRFFNDPCPCYIHRDAVRVRLLAELEEAAGIAEGIPDKEWLERLAHYMGTASITQAEFSEK